MKRHCERPRSRHRQSAGLSLIELLLATALLAAIGAGGLAAYARANAAWHATGIQQRQYERAQYALATLEPELQMAGYFGDGGKPQALETASIPVSATACGVDVVRRLDVPVESGPGYPLPCTASGGGALPDSDVLIVRRASAKIGAPQAGRAQWLSDLTDPGRSVLIWNGEPPAAANPAAPRELHDLIVRIYYVARNADGDAGTPALRVKSLTSIAGVPAFIDTEVMPGVASMQVELQPSADAPARVYLTLQIRPDAADQWAGTLRQPLAVTRHFTLRNAPLHE